MPETLQEVWRRVGCKPGGPKVKSAFGSEYDGLVKSGVPKEEALVRLAGEGGPYSKERYPGKPAGAGLSSVDSPPDEAKASAPAAFSAAKEIEDRKAAVERSQKAKRKLVERAGKKGDQREWADWAGRWQALVVRGDGAHDFGVVKDSPPHPFAVSLLEAWCNSPDKMTADMPKYLGKQGDSGDDEVKFEPKRREELLRLLAEVDAEIKSKGDGAYE
jgi:hypothetical protein